MLKTTNKTGRKITDKTAIACERLIAYLVGKASHSRDVRLNSFLMSRAVTWRSFMTTAVHGLPSNQKFGASMLGDVK